MTATEIRQRALALENRIHKLQVAIYNFSGELEDDGLAVLGELVINAGFEMDVSMQNLKDVADQIQMACGRPRAK